MNSCHLKLWNRFLPLVLLGCVTGCMAPMQMAGGPMRLDDPPYLSPQRQSLRVAPNAVTPGSDLDEAVTSTPESSPSIETSPDNAPNTTDLADDDTGTQSASPQGPTIVVPQRTDPSKLRLQVDVPERVQVGSSTTFELTIENNSEQDAGDLVIEAEFDDAFVFSGREAKQATQTLGVLSSGEQKRIAMSLDCDEVGNHCCRFRLLTDGQEAVWKSVCVEYVARQFDLDIVGPPERMVGSRAEYTVEFANRSQQDWQDVQITVAFDPALKPREASDGVIESDGMLSWTFDRVQSGEGIQLQVEFECLNVAELACLSVVAEGADGINDRRDVCLKIGPAANGLELNIADEMDPVKVGAEAAYAVRLFNRGSQPLQQIQLEIPVPQGGTVAEVVFLEGENRRDIAIAAEDGLIQLPPIDRLDPAAEMNIEIRILTTLPGHLTFQISAIHEGSGLKIESAEVTTVNP